MEEQHHHPKQYHTSSEQFKKFTQHYNSGQHTVSRQENINLYKDALRILRNKERDYTEQAMHSRLLAYVNVMTIANRSLIARCVRTIKAQDLSSERQKMNIMARFWSHRHHWPQGYVGQDDAFRPLNVIQQELMDKRITEVDEVPNAPHFLMGGLYPRTLLSADTIDAFVNALEAVAVENATENMRLGHTPHTSMRAINPRLPGDLKYLFKYTLGIHDPDFRYEGVCKWSFGGVDLTHLHDLHQFRQDATNHFQGMLIRWNGHDGPITCRMAKDLGVVTGFLTGTRHRHGQPCWRSYYIFCRIKPDLQEAPNPGFCWRILLCHFWHRKDGSPTYSRYMFDSIAEFMLWSVQWTYLPNRLNTFINEIWSWSCSDGDSHDVDDYVTDYGLWTLSTSRTSPAEGRYPRNSQDSPEIF